MGEQKAKKEWYKRWWAITIFVLIGLSILGSLVPDDNSSSTDIPTETNTQNQETTLDNTQTNVNKEQSQDSSWYKIIDSSISPKTGEVPFSIIGSVTVKNTQDVLKEFTIDLEKGDLFLNGKTIEVSSNEEKTITVTAEIKIPGNYNINLLAYDPVGTGEISPVLTESVDAKETQTSTPPLEEETDTATMGEKNALKSALSYLDYSAFSYSGLVEQLEYEGFSHEEAVYGADNCGADWNEQAALSAQSYLDYSAFSREGLIEQLEYEGFTREQAEYGVEAVGYE